MHILTGTAYPHGYCIWVKQGDQVTDISLHEVHFILGKIENWGDFGVSFLVAFSTHSVQI